MKYQEIAVHELNQPAPEAVERLNQYLANAFQEMVEKEIAKRSGLNNKKLGDSDGSTARIKIGSGSRQRKHHVQVNGV